MIDNEIKMAIKTLKDGGVIGIPTETVYGLAADIYNKKGIENIFKTKERPFFFLLIIHISNTSELGKLTKEWTELHEKLAKAFWPGPLTFILKKSHNVSDMITSGLDTVGIRMPDHPKTLELINELGSPIAAPSANKFKKISPTSAEHVQSEFPEIQVLNGGDCKVGIESTILKLEENKVIIFRPGMITPKMIKDVLGEDITVEFHESEVAPGHLNHHYMPKKPIIFNVIDLNEDNDELPEALQENLNTWDLPNDSTIAARQLYGKFRELDQQEGPGIKINLTTKQIELDEFKGVINRLIKASSYFLPKKFSNKS